eukprot:873836-Pyramimonas_sp.AAC.1
MIQEKAVLRVACEHAYYQAFSPQRETLSARIDAPSSETPSTTVDPVATHAPGTGGDQGWAAG